MSYEDEAGQMIEAAQTAIQKGERVRILFQILLSELDIEFSTVEARKVFEKLNQVQNEYEEATNILRTIIQTHNEKNRQGVSVSN